MAYTLRGVPQAFQTRDQALAFLTHSPGYMKRQQAYLKRFWPKLYEDAQARVYIGPEKFTRKPGGKGFFSKVADVVSLEKASGTANRAAAWAAEKADPVVAPVGKKAGQALGVGVVTAFNPINLAAIAGAKTLGVGPADDLLKGASHHGGKVGENAAREATQMVVGLPAAPIAALADPTGFAKGIGRDYIERYGRLAKGDLSVLEERPVSFALDFMAGGNIATKLAERAKIVTPVEREAFIHVDGGKTQRYTSPAAFSRHIERKYNAISEAHPDTAVVGARARARRRTVTLQERQMGVLRQDIAKFSQLAKNVKGQGQQMAYDRLHQYGWETPAERAQALRLVGEELETRRGMPWTKAQSRTIRALELAQQHIASPSEHLLATLREGTDLARRVTDAEIEVGRLTPETAQARVDLPARLVNRGLAPYTKADEAAGNPVSAGQAAGPEARTAGDEGAAGRAAQEDRPSIRGGLRVPADQVAWPSADDLHQLSYDIITPYQGVRDPGLIDAAVGAARNRHGYEGGDVFDAAANLANNIQRQQALVDGNKRLGLAAAMDLLDRSGVDVASLAKLNLGVRMREMAVRDLTPDQLAQMMREAVEGTKPPAAGPSAAYLQHTAQTPIKSIAQLPRSINRPKAHKRSQGILFVEGRSRYGTRLVTENALKSARGRVVLQSIDDITREWAKPWKPGDDIPDGYTIWNPEGAKLPRRVREAFDDPDLTPQEVERLLADDYEELAQNVFPTGAQVKGEAYVIPEWVAQGFRSGQMRMPGYGASDLMRAVNAVVDSANNLFRLRIYVKPGYFVNYASNMAVGAIKQGPWFARNLKNSLEQYSKLKPDTLARIDEIAGTSASIALEGPGASNRGLLANATQAVGSFMNRATDKGPRRMAVIHELEKHGLNDDAAVNAFLDRVARGDAKAKATYNTIAEEAQNSMGRFEGLGPVEREYLTRYIAVYPWLKAATRWGVRLPWDAPVRATILAHAGLEGWDYAKEKLGEVATFLEKYVPLPGGKVNNLGTLTPLQTGVDVARGATKLATGQGDTNASQLLGPFGAAVTQGLTGEDTLGRDAQGGAFGALWGQQDDFGLPRTVKDLVSPPGETKYWKDQGRAGTLGQFAVGGLWPREPKLEAWQKKGRDEKLARLPFEKRTYVREMREEQAVARKAGMKLPGFVAADLRKKAKLENDLHDAEGDAKKTGGKLTYMRRLEILGPYIGVNFQGLDLPEDLAERYYDKYRPYAYPGLTQWRKTTGVVR